MNTASRKAKGKRLQKAICHLILKYFHKLQKKMSYQEGWEEKEKILF